VLFGPSGAGKTLTLHCLAGLTRPDAGRLVVVGRVFFDAASGVDLAPQRRRVGYDFQGYALFPHLTVAGNLGFGLRDRPRAVRARRVADVAARLGTLRMLLDEPGPPAQDGDDLEVEVPSLVHEILEIDRDRSRGFSIHRGSIHVLPS
jgi:ABC-type sulfate/molybdate transport systems ATPase subunit